MVAPNTPFRFQIRLPVSFHIRCFITLFTALHGMQTRSSDENSVCLSVRPSHPWIVTKR